MTSATIIPSHTIASALLEVTDGLLGLAGLDGNGRAQDIVYTVLVLAIALVIGRIVRHLMLLIVRRAMKLRSKNLIIGELLEAHTPTGCSHIIPPLVFIALIPFSFTPGHAALHVIMRCGVAYLLVTVAVALCSILRFVWAHYNRHENTDNHPLKGVYNIARGVVWAVTVICCVSVLIDRSPLTLLGGLGVFAAALMLIFKDSILGFVAGVQLSSNDMLRVGDWIVVPSTPANGTVMDVSLSVVKVRNWDNTVVTLPPYTLVSTSFQNWRGMYETGCRQIQRSVYIDNRSIAPATPDLLRAIAAKYPAMARYISGQQASSAARYNTGGRPLNGTIGTNLGLYRAYICEYLLAHPKISDTSDLIVRLMQPEAYGTPLQLYCFTNDTSWVVYEAIQSEIFEHLSATAPDFNLTIYNIPDSISARRS